MLQSACEATRHQYPSLAGHGLTANAPDSRASLRLAALQTTALKARAAGSRMPLRRCMWCWWVSCGRDRLICISLTATASELHQCKSTGRPTPSKGWQQQVATDGGASSTSMVWLLPPSPIALLVAASGPSCSAVSTQSRRLLLIKWLSLQCACRNAAAWAPAERRSWRPAVFSCPPRPLCIEQLEAIKQQSMSGTAERRVATQVCLGTCAPLARPCEVADLLEDACWIPEHPSCPLHARPHLKPRSHSRLGRPSSRPWGSSRAAQGPPAARLALPACLPPLAPRPLPLPTAGQSDCCGQRWHRSCSARCLPPWGAAPRGTAAHWPTARQSPMQCGSRWAAAASAPAAAPPPPPPPLPCHQARQAQLAMAGLQTLLAGLLAAPPAGQRAGQPAGWPAGPAAAAAVGASPRPTR